MERPENGKIGAWVRYADELEKQGDELKLKVEKVKDVLPKNPSVMNREALIDRITQANKALKE